MKRLAIFLTLAFYLSVNVLAGFPLDSLTKLRFQKLAERMRLKVPELKEGDYEIRIWNSQALRYGDAQMLYVLTKTKKQFSVFKYIIESDRQGFRHAVQLNTNPKISIDDALWEQFVHEGIINLPHMSAIRNKLFPKPQKDSTWTVVEADGSVSVKAKRDTTRSVYITDGEGYYFEVFGAHNYRSYAYSNPREYIKYKPNIVELQKVVAILNDLAALFRSSN